MKRRDVAWILILIVDAGFIAWGAGATASPGRHWTRAASC